MLLPARWLSPSSGVQIPARILPSVLLPAPFSPISAWRLPRSTSMLTRSSASTPGKRLVTLWKERKLIELLTQPTGTIGRDAVHAGSRELPGFDGRIDGPDVNLQAGALQFSDENCVDGAAGVQIDAIESGLVRRRDQLAGTGRPAGGFPVVSEAADPTS